MDGPSPDTEGVFPAVEAGSTFGVAYLAVAFSSLLYGVACLQTFQYFNSRRAPTDPMFIKLLVTFFIVFSTIHQALVIKFFYDFLVTGHGLPVEALYVNTWMAPALSEFEAVIGFAGDCFLIYRIWKLSGNLILVSICLVLTVAFAIAQTVFSVRAILNLDINLAVSEIRLNTNGIVDCVLTAAADIVIMAGMAYYLLKNRTGFRKSNQMIQRLLALVITTGALSSLMAIATLIAFIVEPAGMTLVFFNVLAARIYDNAFLTLLNVRDHIQGVWGDDTTITRGTTLDFSSTIQLTQTDGAQTYQRSQALDGVVAERSEDLERDSGLTERKVPDADRISLR